MTRRRADGPGLDIFRTRLPYAFRSTGVRFSALFAALLAATAAVLAVFLWWSTAGLLDRQTEAAIHADALNLSERCATGGLPALVLTIEDRLAQNVDDDQSTCWPTRRCGRLPATCRSGRRG